MASSQADVGRMNCAGAGCQERNRCRRYQVFIPARGSDPEHPHGAWGSFDVERQQHGDCKAFATWRGGL